MPATRGRCDRPVVVDLQGRGARVTLCPQHGTAVVGCSGRQGLFRSEGHELGQPRDVGHGAVRHGPIRTDLLAHPVAKNRPVGQVVHLAVDMNMHVGYAVFRQMKPPTRCKTGQRRGQRRQARFTVGDERGPGVGKTNGVGFRPRGDAGLVLDATVVGRARQGGVDAQALVRLNNLKLLLEKIGPLDVHFFHFFTVAACRVQRGRDGHVAVAVRREVLQEAA